MMSRESTCRCLICDLERSLTVELEERHRQERYRQFADSRSLLSAFPSAADLLAYLHSSRKTRNGAHPTDRILVELLRVAATDGDSAALRDLLLLAFIPTLHSTVRRVRKRYPALSREDAAQQALGALLEYLASTHLASRDTYVGFAIARKVRRATFEWAAKEARSPLDAPRSDNFWEMNSIESAEESFERASLLRHFFGRAVEGGTLTPSEFNLLVQFKLEGGAENGAFSNAERQRLKRLLGKLRRLASGNRRCHPTP